MTSKTATIATCAVPIPFGTSMLGSIYSWRVPQMQRLAAMGTEFREVAPFTATLALYRVNKGSKLTWVALFDEATGSVWPMSAKDFYNLAQHPRATPSVVPSNAKDEVAAVLRQADFTPSEQRPSACNLSYLSTWWRYSWTGMWSTRRRGQAFGIYLHSREAA